MPNALASYARQADDDTLRKMADRIQARAVRRCGELLKQYDGRGGDRSKNGGAVTSAPSQKQAATDAGMSERQRVTAVRIPNVPAETFESAVESDAPPTITKLAELGRQSRPAPEGFQQATHLIGAVRRYRCRLSDLCFVEFSRRSVALPRAPRCLPTAHVELAGTVLAREFGGRRSRPPTPPRSA